MRLCRFLAVRLNRIAHGRTTAARRVRLVSQPIQHGAAGGGKQGGDTWAIVLPAQRSCHSGRLLSG